MKDWAIICDTWSFIPFSLPTESSKFNYTEASTRHCANLVSALESVLWASVTKAIIQCTVDIRKTSRAMDNHKFEYMSTSVHENRRHQRWLRREPGDGLEGTCRRCWCRGQIVFHQLLDHL